MTARAFVLVVLALSALAGCLAAPAETVDSAGLLPVDPSRILPYLDLSDGHHHGDPSHHAAGWSVETLGWTPFEEGPAGRYNHVQVHGDFAFVSAYRLPPDMRPGMVVVDLSDPAAPRVVGRYVTDWTTPVDVHLSEDGKWAALAGHRHGAIEQPSGPCTNIPVPSKPATVCRPYVPAGIELLDVSDPANPKLAARWTSAPSGGHTVKLATIGGELYAFVDSYGVHWAERPASSVEIVRYDAEVPGGFSPVARFFPDEPSWDGVFVHDLWIAAHPKTEELLLYVAYWDGGVVVANVDDPGHPRQIAVWKEFDAAQYGNVHFARPMPVLVDGKHYTVAAPEHQSAEHAGETYILDTTDPAAPKLLAKWSLPGDPVNPGDYAHSPHYFDLSADGVMVMAHYHAGVWVVDLRPVFAGQGEPEVLGYRFTVPPEGANVQIADDVVSPSVWNALWWNGHIVASDMASGLHVLHWAPPAEGEVPPYSGIV